MRAGLAPRSLQFDSGAPALPAVLFRSIHSSLLSTMKLPLPFLALALLSAALGSAADSSVPSRSFGRLSDGKEAQVFTLKNASGFQAEITNLGGIIVSIMAPDRRGVRADVILGVASAGEFEAKAAGFNAITGRFANRIAGGKFVLDGKTYPLATNATSGGVPVHLHGGNRGFNRAIWQAEPTTRDGLPALRLRHLSPDGDEGYPGNLKVEVTYSVTADNALRIDYMATTDKPTPLNLTNHAYFNLKGEGQGDILDHVVMLKARRYTPAKPTMIPTGEIAPVAGTPFDFTTPQRLGARIGEPHEQLLLARGYDHNFVLDSTDGSLALAATVVEPASGRRLEVLTTEPGVQLFTANHFAGKVVGKAGRAYEKHGGFCLETQHFPDSPNQPNFPSTILRPGTTFRSTTVFRFSAQ
jgi:aldose 1-epimerase